MVGVVPPRRTVRNVIKIEVSIGCKVFGHNRYYALKVLLFVLVN